MQICPFGALKTFEHMPSESSDFSWSYLFETTYALINTSFSLFILIMNPLFKTK
jgi:hypothetical protein